MSVSVLVIYSWIGKPGKWENSGNFTQNTGKVMKLHKKYWKSEGILPSFKLNIFVK